VDWAERELLDDVPHRQVVFTIPKRLRIFFRHDRLSLGELAGCAWRALKLYFAAYFDDADATPGAVGFVQTAGELLNFHPHVHVLVTDGGFLPDDSFRPLAWFDSPHVERLLFEAPQIAGRHRPLPDPLPQLGRKAELPALVAQLENHKQDSLQAMLDFGC
jgi:hypothetical protein